MTGVLLYQWSTAAQLISVLMIALFYATLARSLRRADVVWWARSWWCNFAALALAFTYWFFTPPPFGTIVVRALYVGGKFAYALLLIEGAWALRAPGGTWLSRRALSIIIGASVLLGAVVLSTINLVGIAVQGTMGVLFLWCGVVLFRERAKLAAWLGIAFLARGSFALVEAFAYGANTAPPGTFSPELASRIALFLGAHSSIDIAAEWLLALGGVVALARRSQDELQTANEGLLCVQGELRRLVDVDPLTELANRRVLPEAFRDVFMSGAALVFCDIDDFKQVNDTYGHPAGDVCLQRFAGALRTTFRPTDVIVRYAGDEFLVVCKGMELSLAHARVERLRAKLAEGGRTEIPLEFSAGIVELRPQQDAEEALRDADAAMYAAKTTRV
ncbi:MAG: GGDEF domain-containing protein [Gemmatimonadaceae bacterium]